MKRSTLFKIIFGAMVAATLLMMVVLWLTSIYVTKSEEQDHQATVDGHSYVVHLEPRITLNSPTTHTATVDVRRDDVLAANIGVRFVVVDKEFRQHKAQYKAYETTALTNSNGRANFTANFSSNLEAIDIYLTDEEGTALEVDSSQPFYRALYSGGWYRSPVLMNESYTLALLSIELCGAVFILGFLMVILSFIPARKSAKPAPRKT